MLWMFILYASFTFSHVEDPIDVHSFYLIPYADTLGTDTWGDKDMEAFSKEWNG